MPVKATLALVVLAAAVGLVCWSSSAEAVSPQDGSTSQDDQQDQTAEQRLQAAREMNRYTPETEAEIQKTIGILKQALADESPVVRAAALNAMAPFIHVDATILDELTKRARTDVAEVKVVAMRRLIAYTSLQTPPADVLWELLSDDDITGEDRAALLDYMVRLGRQDEQILAKAIELLKTGNEREQLAMLELIPMFKSKAEPSLELLTELATAESSAPAIKAAALSGLASITIDVTSIESNERKSQRQILLYTESTLDRYDADKDGRITVNEVGDHRSDFLVGDRGFGSTITTKLTTVDADGDFVVTRQELMTFAENFVKRQQTTERVRARGRSGSH